MSSPAIKYDLKEQTEDILDRFKLVSSDSIDISHNETQLIVERLIVKFCLFINVQGIERTVKIGGVWISKEGIKELIEYMNHYLKDDLPLEKVKSSFTF